MTQLTEAGRRVIADLAGRYGLSHDAVETMARAVSQGGGTMAQFNIPELGGSGQWMAGGMTMVGDMFNSGLQNTVTNLCGELANAMAESAFFEQPPQPGGAGGWWPTELGAPAAVGGQNQIRYAYFPSARRLAVDTGAAVIVLDTLDHQIGGFSQQQSGPMGGDPLAGVTFSSQFGQFALSSLPRADGAAQPVEPAAPPELESEPEPSEPGPAAATVFEAPEPPSAPSAAAPSGGLANAEDIFAAIERLAALRDAGALTEDEFAGKKSELLARL